MADIIKMGTVLRIKNLFSASRGISTWPQSQEGSPFVCEMVKMAYLILSLGRVWEGAHCITRGGANCAVRPDSGLTTWLSDQRSMNTRE